MLTFQWAQWASYGLAAALAVGAAHGAEVRLTAQNGATTLVGVLSAFDEKSYTLTTEFGVLKINRTQVTCDGAACPALDPPAFRIALDDGIDDALVSDLLSGFALAQDAALTKLDDQVWSLAQADGTAEISYAAFSTDPSGDGVDFAVLPREANDDEARSLGFLNKSDLVQAGAASVAALDGIVFVTSPQNPVKALTPSQIAQIFGGRITNWSQVGGDDIDIQLVMPAPDSALATSFDATLLRPNRVRLPSSAYFTSNATVLETTVNSAPGAIGLTRFSDVENGNVLDVAGACGIRTPANEFTIKTEEYPFAMRLYGYQSRDSLGDDSVPFARYVASEDGQRVFSTTGLVGQYHSDRNVASQGLRFLSATMPTEAEYSLSQLQNLSADLFTASRSSLTFRFDSGSSSLDDRSLGEVTRLAHMLQSGALEGKEVMLMGFTDSVGRAEQNLSLSAARASKVRAALLAQLEQDAGTFARQVVSKGYGELSPLLCNDDRSGRGINRRVEVWIRDWDQTTG